MNTNNTNIDDPPQPRTNVGEDNKEGKNRKKNLKNRENNRKKKRAEEKEEMKRQLANLPPPLWIPIPDPDEPDLVLPPELFVNIFSLLDPFMIAICHLVCKSWRLSILLRSVLYYAELDLSRLGIGVEDRILQSFPDYFLHLSSRANDRLVKVSLNMFFLWKDYIAKNQIYQETFAFKLFGSLLFRSRETLREISLRFVLERLDFCAHNLSFFPLLSSILEQLQSYPFLKSIYIKGPAGVSFNLGSGQKRVRAFQVEDNCDELDEEASDTSDNDGEYQEPEVSHIAPIIEWAKRFVGDEACFSEFKTSVDLGGSYQNASSSLLDLLSVSTSSLEILELGSIKGIDFWGFVVQCDNLKTLSIDLSSAENPLELEPPEESSINSRLGSFELQALGGYSIDWNLTAPWLGGNLTHLSLDQKSNEDGNYLLMNGPSDLTSILQNITATITHINLFGLHPRVETGGATMIKNLKSLSNLKSLTLAFLHPTFFDFFNTSLTYPNLQELSVSYGDNSQSPVQCLLALLKANSSNLVRIEFMPYSAPVELPSVNLSLEFNKLETLEFGGGEEVGLWFSTLSNSFPRLSMLSTDREAFRSKASLLFSSEYSVD